MPAKIDYTGACRKMNNGQMATVIAYKNSRHMTVQFEDGQKAEIIDWHNNTA